MLEKNFDKHFKKGLTKIQAFEFDEDAWLGLSHSLQTHSHSARRRTLFKRLSVAASVLLLIASNFYLYSRLSHSEQQLEDMNNLAAAAQQAQPSTPTAPAEATARGQGATSITPSPSTMARFVAMGNEAKETSPAPTRLTRPNVPSVSYFATEITGKNTALATAQKDAPESPDKINVAPGNNVLATAPALEESPVEPSLTENNAAENAPTTSGTNAFDDTAQLVQQTTKEATESQLFEQTAITDEKTEMNDWYYLFLPEGYHLGLTGAKSVLAREIVSKSDKVLEGGWSAGLRGEMVFNDNLRLYSDVDYLKTSLVSHTINESDIPEVPLPSEMLVLQSVAISRSYLEYSLGLKYVLYNARKRFAPYAGAAFKAHSGLRQKYDYVYESGSPDVSNYATSLKTEDKKFQINTVNLQMGMEYNIARDFLLQVEGFYNAPIKKEAAQVPNLFGLKAGVVCSI